MSENQITKVTVTSPAYLAGREACQDSLARKCAPNWPLVRRLGAEFFAGFGDEWDDLTLNEDLAYDEDRVTELAASRLASQN